MRRRWTHPVVSLAALGVIICGLVILPAPATQAQRKPYPGESDPIGNRPGALTQFPDDELVVMSDTVRSNAYYSVALSPNPDDSLPAQVVNSDVLPYPPTGALIDPDGGYQQRTRTARGRIVEPTREVALVLSKIGTATYPTRLTWALQELSFGTANPATPKTVPALTWTTQVVQGQVMATNSPGALAVGDLDRVLTPNPTLGAIYNDEAVVAYEVRDGDFSQVQLDVVSYSAVPGKATVVASASTKPSGVLGFAYPCNISWLSFTDGRPCPMRHPGNIELAVGDVDGDGYNEIAQLATVALNGINYLRSDLYSYCPPALAADDPRVVVGTCTAGAAAPTLKLRGSAVVDAAQDGAIQNAIFQSPAKIIAGDYDGDGVEEMAVLSEIYQSTNSGGTGSTPGYGAELQVSMLQWSAATSGSKTWQVVWTNNLLGSQAVDVWYDGRGAGGGPARYYDIEAVAGLFKYDPEQGYGIGRRQLAVASPIFIGGQQLQLYTVLYEWSSPTTPVAKPPATWEADLMVANLKALACDWTTQTHASVDLIAGNWSGVKASPADPRWGLGLSYEGVNDNRIELLRVGPQVDPKTGTYPLTVVASTAVPKYGDGGACGDDGVRNELVAMDYDGDALQLGPPMHIVVQRPLDFDWILQEPPQHLDYFPDGGLVNVSRNPDFNVGYQDAKAKAFAVGAQANSTWDAGVSVRGNATVGTDDNLILAELKVSASVTAQFNYDHLENKSSYASSSDIYTTTVETQTSGGDSLRFRSKITDIWRYPAYGVKSSDPGQPFAYYELSLPRANDTPYQDMDDLAAQTYGYQPQHENGNLLSYPAVPAGDALEPADLGPWLLPRDSQGGPDAVRCENDTRWCLSTPITNAGQQFTFGGNKNTLTLQIDQSSSNSSSRSWTEKFSASVDVEASTKFDVAGTGGSACLDIQPHGGYSWGASSTATFASDETQTLSINVPANNDNTVPYHFNPMMYVTGDGTLKVAHGAGVDNGGSFWQSRYFGADPALNLPRKFNQPGGATGWEINKAWLDAQEMRGFWVRSTTSNPISKTYDVVEGVAAGEQVFLDARVYNYSVGTATGNVPVRFDLQPVDPVRTYLATGPRFTAGTASSGTIPFHGQTNSADQVLDNYGSVRYQLDTSKLLPAGAQSQTYRVWVVLDPQDPGNQAGQTHGWRQPNVILTPQKSLQAGTPVVIDLYDQNGKQETVTYESKGTDDNIAAGLVDQLSRSSLVQQFGAQLNMQDSTTSAPSVVMYRSDAQAPASTEFRAGMVVGNQALYVVPRLPANNRAAPVTASNLEYGQNNEGWGLLTVHQKSLPGPMLGGDDPCALSSGYSAERGPDIRLGRGSLTPQPANAGAAGSKTVVRAGDRVPIRVSAFADTDWAGHERVTVFQGAPDGGTVAGTATIRGIDKDNGGHGWFTWQAPSQPGTYKLVAQLQESSNDSVPGNHTAAMEIVVEAGPQLPYRRWLGAISKAPN